MPLVEGFLLLGSISRKSLQQDLLSSINHEASNLSGDGLVGWGGADNRGLEKLGLDPAGETAEV